jgi:DNA-binding transcriptional ArsR family regulator
VTEREVRQITDSRVLAAMAHPLRRRLMDVLKVHGPATVSTLAERTGQAVGNVSHHLRVLADGGLVEEAPQLARDRRERWWQLVSSTLRWSARDFGDDPAAVAVAHAAESLNLDRQVGLVRAWFAGSESCPGAWREQGPFSTDAWLHLTPGELTELAQQIISLINQWADREIPDDGQQREPVFVFARGVPGQP